MKGESLTLSELGNTYVGPKDRFVVSLIVGYQEDDDPKNPITTPEQAARWALDLTRDEGAAGTNWYVFDRQTGILHCLEQHDFDPEMVIY